MQKFRILFYKAIGRRKTSAADLLTAATRNFQVLEDAQNISKQIVREISEGQPFVEFGRLAISMLHQGCIFEALQVCETTGAKIPFDQWIQFLRILSLTDLSPETLRFFDRKIVPQFHQWEKGLSELSAINLLDLAWSLVLIGGKSQKPNSAVHITKAIGDVLLKRVEARDLNPYQLVDVVEIYSGLQPATVHRTLLLTTYSVLLERHGYLQLPLRHLIRLMLAITAADYRHTVLVTLVAQTIGDRIASETDPDARVKIEGFRALAGSYAFLESWRIRGAACQAMLEISQNQAADELGNFFIAACHFAEGIEFPPKFLDFLETALTVKFLASLDPQTLGGVCLGLCMHGLQLRAETEVSCACNLDSLGDRRPPIDYRALRVTIKPAARTHKNTRWLWMRDKNPDLMKLHREIRQVPPEKKFPCCGTNGTTEVDLLRVTRLICRAFAVAISSSEVARASLGLLPPTSEDADALAQISLVPAEYQAQLATAPKNEQWGGERRQNVHWTACDLLMAVQILLDSDAPLHLLTLAELQTIRNVAEISRNLAVSGGGRLAFIAGQKPPDVVHQVKSTLARVAHLCFARPEIKMDVQVCDNFRTDLLVTSS